MACCLTAPSHYLNQCWLIIDEVPWHSSQGIILRWCEDTNQLNKIENCSFKMASRSPRGQWVKYAHGFAVVCFAVVMLWVRGGYTWSIYPYSPGLFKIAPVLANHDDVIKWKHFPRYWPFVRGIHGEFPHKGQWRGALMFSFICAWINVWVNNCKQSRGWWFETP